MSGDANSTTTPSFPNGEDLLQVDGLCVEFAGQTVLRDIHLTIPRGQTVAIIGESGCGKTVLLKSMIGLIAPTRGAVLFDHRELHRLGEKELTRQRLRFGFVFQNAALFDSQTVGQNVAFPLRQHGRLRNCEKEIEQVVMERLTEVGLPPAVLRKKPEELSGGMRKRVGVARALVMNPEVVLYDEPTTGLDPIMSDVINELIIRSRRRYTVTSLVVTHDMRTARKVADRVVMLFPASRLRTGENQVIFDGPPSELDRTDDRRVSQFVRGEAGERLMELVHGHNGHNGVRPT